MVKPCLMPYETGTAGQSVRRCIEDPGERTGERQSTVCLLNTSPRNHNNFYNMSLHFKNRYNAGRAYLMLNKLDEVNRLLECFDTIT